jgi:hypothetical protein
MMRLGLRFPGAVLVLATAFETLAFAPPVRADVAACIDANEKSLALRKAGKLKDALTQLTVCADVACPDEVKAECARRIGEVKSAEPELILGAKDGAGNDLFDVKVAMDGAPLVSSLDGRPLAIDPGAHTFTFTAVGQPAVDKQLVLREGEKGRHETVILGAASVGATAATPPTPAPQTSSGGLGTQKTLAIVSGGVGVVGVVLGAVFGASASSSQSSEKSACPSAGCSPSAHAQATSDYTSAKNDATASSVAFIAGAAFVAAGAVLWFTAPRETGTTAAAASLHVRRVGLQPVIMPAGGSVLLGGEF